MESENKSKTVTKLTAKQKRFCEEYVIDNNATQAAIRAGYSENTAKEQASQNLTKLNIQNYISELKNQIAEFLDISTRVRERCFNVEFFQSIKRNFVLNFLSP